MSCLEFVLIDFPFLSTAFPQCHWFIVLIFRDHLISLFFALTFLCRILFRFILLILLWFLSDNPRSFVEFFLLLCSFVEKLLVLKSYPHGIDTFSTALVGYV